MSDEKLPRWLFPLLAGVAVVAVTLTLVVQWAGVLAFDAVALRVRERIALFSAGQGRLPVGVLTEIRKSPMPVADALALIYSESHGNPSAVSPVGALGCWQVMPVVAAKYGYKPGEMFDAVKCTKVGLRHHAAMMVTFRSNQTNALLAWSAGASEARRQLNARTMPAETRQLIARVASTKRRLVRWLDDGMISLE